MRLVILLLAAFIGTMFWATVSFGVLFGVTHDPRFGEDFVVCFGGLVLEVLLLVCLIQYSAVRSVRH